MEILALVLLGILAVWLSVWTVIIVLQSRDIADMAKQITKAREEISDHEFSIAALQSADRSARYYEMNEKHRDKRQ